MQKQHVGEPSGNGARAGEPVWLVVLAGWMFARTVLLVATPPGVLPLEAFPTPGSPPRPPVVGDLRSGVRGIDLERSPPRVLRRLPGIGRRRAVDIAGARWEHEEDGPLELRAIRGIGPKTEARVREWLEAAEQERSP